MKTAILALFLCAATSAVCQSAALSPLESGKAPFTQLQMTSDDLPSGEQSKILAQLRNVVIPKMKAGRHWDDAGRHWDDAGIDPKIIAHPPQSRLGVQTPGTQVARNEYPNLLLLPIDLTSVQPQAMPTQWPSFSVRAISTQWPQFKLLLIQNGVTATPASAAK